MLTDTANAVYIYGHWPVLIAAGVVLSGIGASSTTSCATAVW